MVDLPRVVNDSTTQPVRANLSGSEAASPWQQIAHSLDKGGEALNEVAVQEAEKAGEQAGKSVRVDDNGNMVGYTPPPLVGAAAVAFRRRATLSAATEMEPQIQNKMLELRLAHPNAPDQFQAAAKQYGETLLAKVNDPHLRAGIGTMLSQSAAHNYRTSLVETNADNISKARQDYVAKITDLNEQGASLARQGLDHTPEYESVQRGRAQFYRDMAADPNMKWSPARIALEEKTNRDNDIVQLNIGRIQREFTADPDKNLFTAKQKLVDTFWGKDSEKLSLTAAKRDHAVTEGMKAITGLYAQDREAISENATAVNGFVGQTIKNPRVWNDLRHNDMEDRSNEIGDKKSLHKLQQLRAIRPLLDDINGQGPQEAVKTLETLNRGFVPDEQTKTFFNERGRVRIEGVSPNFALRLRSAIEDAEKATGERAQLNSMVRTTDEQAAAFRRYQTGQGGLAAPPGTSRHEQGRGEAADIQPGKVLDYLHANAGRYGLEFLKGEAFRKDPVHIQLASQGELPLADSAGRFDIHGASPSGMLFQSVAKHVGEIVAKQSRETLTEIQDRLKRGQALEPGSFEAGYRAAIDTSQTELIDKYKEIGGAEAVKASMPIGASPANIEAQARTLAASGVNEIERKIFNTVAEQTKNNAEALKKDPLGRGADAGWWGPNNQLNMENPHALAGELQDRWKKSQLMPWHAPNFGPVPLINNEEGAEFGTFLTSGDPKLAVQALTALKTLPDQAYVATMAQKPIRDAVIAMSMNNDPMRFGAGMNTMASLWKTHPAEFEHIYGSETLTRVQAYQGLQGTLTGQEIVERMNGADDPAKSKARKDRAEEVDKEFSNWNANDVAYQIGTGGIAGFFHRGFGLTPETPRDAQSETSKDSIAGDEMKYEFENTVKSLRTYGTPLDKAKELAIERMKSIYQVSPTNGGVLMKRAPELYYPKIAGNHDWLQADLQDKLTATLGQQVTSTPSGEGFATTVNWSFRGLVADDQTEREVKTGQPPSYRVAITDAKGQMQWLTDPKTGSDRISWDPKDRQEHYAERQKQVFDTSATTVEYRARAYGLRIP